MNLHLKHSLLVLAALLWWPALLWSQGYADIFPELSGEALLAALVREYKPQQVLDYRSAREVMYTSIYNENDSVKCVYSGYTLYLPPEESNPVTHLLKFGTLNGIITEHTYPRSKGADEGNAKSDMHHLFPARLGVNISRLNHPFGEIPDELTEKWYYLDDREKTTPTHHIEWYSEKGDGVFEPREDHKGNVARAMFYFYTMYREEALSEDPEFFNSQLPTLCEWHYLDPVDEKERIRTYQIAEYQDGKPNPFVLDGTLVSRAYCPERKDRYEVLTQDKTPYQQPSAATLTMITNWNVLEVFPKPVSPQSNILVNLEDSALIQLALYDRSGKELVRLLDSYFFSGKYEIPFPAYVLQNRPGEEISVRLRIHNGYGNQKIFTDVVQCAR